SRPIGSDDPSSRGRHVRLAARPPARRMGVYACRVPNPGRAWPGWFGCVMVGRVQSRPHQPATERGRTGENPALPRLPPAPVALALASAASAPAPADDDLTVLKPGPNDTPTGRRLYQYLESQAKVKFEARRKLIAGLKTEEAIKGRQAEIGARFRDALGEL